MSTTALLGLPLIDAAQSQKHVTHNEALLLLDACVHLAVKSRQLASPPSAPAEGDRYLVPASATGGFAGQVGAIGLWQSGAWSFLAPRAGWRLYVQDENRLLVFDGTAWGDPQIDIVEIGNLLALGIGTAADPVNALSVKANTTLFTAKSTGEGGTGDLRYVLNKSTTGNTVSQLYQDNYSGRAETGLTGDDNFHIKVSADGARWREALNIDAASGKVSFPSGVGAGSLAGFRNRLMNGSFLINQRDYASGTATAAPNQYTLDRWRVVVAGQSISWVASGIDNVVTAPAGGMEQVVEGLGIEGGTYTLSWSGTATAMVNGAAVANGGQVTLPVGANATVRFSGGTVSQAQLEPGNAASAFERRPFGNELLLCQRYFYRSGGTYAWQSHGFGLTTPTTFMMNYILPTPMRVSPTLTVNNVSSFGIADGIGGFTPSAIYIQDPASNLNTNVQVWANISGAIGGRAARLYSVNNPAATLDFSAEF